MLVDGLLFRRRDQRGCGDDGSVEWLWVYLYLYCSLFLYALNDVSRPVRVLAAPLYLEFCIRYFSSSTHTTTSNISLDIKPLVQRLGHVDQSLVDIPVVDAKNLGSL
jgi:hypothetical protein